MQRHTSQKKPRAFSKAIVLFICLLFVLYLYRQFKNGDVLKQFFSAFDSAAGTEQIDIVEYDESEKDNVLKQLAGFWVHTSENVHNPFFIDDRIELKDNGIIWRIKQMKYKLPSENTVHSTHLSHVYLVPFGYNAKDTAQIVCNAVVLRQVWITSDNDTCDIDHYTQDSWNISVYNNKLAFGKREYTPYTDFDVTNFFTPGLLDIIYKLTRVDSLPSESAYEVRKGEVAVRKPDAQIADIDRKAYQTCSSDDRAISFIRHALIQDIRQEENLDRYSVEKIASLLRQYYVPYCLTSQKIVSDLGEKQSAAEVSVSIDLTWQGDVENVSVQLPEKELENKITRKIKEEMIVEEIKKWKFPRLKSEQPPLTVTLKGIL